MVMPASLMYRELGFGRRECGRELHTVMEREAEDALLRSNSLRFDAVAFPAAEQPRLLPANQAVNLVVISPDGLKLASAHADHRIHIICTKTSKVISTLKERHTMPVFALAFHPRKSELLATGCTGGKVCVWELEGRGSESLVLAEVGGVASLAFHPLLRCLAVGVGDRLLLWDWTEAEPFSVSRTARAGETLRYVGFDERGERLFTAVSNQPLLPPPDDAGLNAARTADPTPHSRVYNRRELLQSYREALSIGGDAPLSTFTAQAASSSSVQRDPAPAGPMLADSIARRVSGRGRSSEESGGPSRPKRTRPSEAAEEAAGPSHRPLEVAAPETLFAEALPTAAFDATGDVVQELFPGARLDSPSVGANVDVPSNNSSSSSSHTLVEAPRNAALRGPTDFSNLVVAPEGSSGRLVRSASIRPGPRSAFAPVDLESERRRRDWEVEEVEALVAEATARRDRLNEQLQQLQRMSQNLSGVFRDADGQRPPGVQLRTPWNRTDLRIDAPQPRLNARRLPRLTERRPPPLSLARAVERDASGADSLRATINSVQERRRQLIHSRQAYVQRIQAGLDRTTEATRRVDSSIREAYRHIGAEAAYERLRGGREGLGLLGGPSCCRLRPTVRLQRWWWPEHGARVPLEEAESGRVASAVRLRNDNSLAFSRDGLVVACMTGVEATDMRLEVASLREGDLGRVLYSLSFGPSVLACLAFSPTDSHLLVGLSDGPECMLGLHNLFRPFARVFRLMHRDDVLQPPHAARKKSSGGGVVPGELKPVLNLKRSGAGGLGRGASADVSSMAWLRTPGSGFLYASRKGSLTLISPRLSEDAAETGPVEGPSGPRSLSGPPLEEQEQGRLVAMVANLRRRIAGRRSPTASSSSDEELVI